MPAKSARFVKDTWVQLFEVYEISGIETNPDISYYGHLPEKTFKALIDCLLDSQAEDLSKHQLDMLRPQTGVSLKGLASHFNNRRP